MIATASRYWLRLANAGPVVGCGDMEMAMKRTAMILAVLAFLSSALLAGCNTIEGAGKDLKKAGEKIEGAAK